MARITLLLAAALLACWMLGPAASCQILAVETDGEITAHPVEGALRDAMRLGDAAFVQGETIGSLAWSHDSTMVATAAGRRYGITPADETRVRGLFRDPQPQPASPKNTIRVWLAPQGHLLAELIGHRTGIAELRFSPDGQFLASIDDEGDCIVWDVKRRAIRFHHRVEARRILCCEWSEDSKSVCLGVNDGRIVLIDLQKAKPTTERECALDPIVAIRYRKRQDWRFAAMNGRTGDLSVGTFAPGDVPISLRVVGQGNPERARTVHWSRNGDRVAYCADATTVVLRNTIDSSTTHVSFKTTVRLVAQSPDRSTLAALAGRELGLIALEDGKSSWHLHQNTDEADGCWPGPNGAELAVTRDRRAAIVTRPSPDEGLKLPAIKGHWSAVQSVVWTRNGERLMSTDGIDVLEWSTRRSQAGELEIIRRMRLPRRSARCQLISRELTDDAAYVSPDTRALVLLTEARWGESVTSREIRQAKQCFWGSDSDHFLLFVPPDRQLFHYSLRRKNTTPYLDVKPSIKTIVAADGGRNVGLLSSDSQTVICIDGQKRQQEVKVGISPVGPNSELAPASGAPVFVLTGRSARGFAAAYVNLAQASVDWTWEAPDFLPRHPHVTANGRYVVLCGGVGNLYVIDGLTGRPIANVGNSVAITSATVSPKADHIAFVDAFGIRLLNFDQLLTRTGPHDNPLLQSERTHR